jgi:invasion protein IalB
LPSHFLQIIAKFCLSRPHVNPYRDTLLALGGICAKQHRIGAALGAGLLASLPAVAVAQQTAAFPNGASSLQETYEDWTLSCAVRNNARGCVVSQNQVQQNGQRLLAAEVTTTPNGGAIATLLLPFGILLDAGIAPQIDDQSSLAPVRFRTCLPNGCIARFQVDPATLKRLRAGISLKLKVTTDAETPLTLPVSLKGLSAALDRAKALSGS